MNNILIQQVELLGLKMYRNNDYLPENRKKMKLATALYRLTAVT